MSQEFFSLFSLPAQLRGRREKGMPGVSREKTIWLFPHSFFLSSRRVANTQYQEVYLGCCTGQHGDILHSGKKKENGLEGERVSWQRKERTNEQTKSKRVAEAPLRRASQRKSRDVCRHTPPRGLFPALRAQGALTAKSAVMKTYRCTTPSDSASEH